MSTRVLIVEPDATLVEGYVSFFSQQNDLLTATAMTGQDCLTKLREFRPDVLILEPSLPCGMCEEILHAVGEVTDRAGIPVIVLTRLSRESIEGIGERIKELYIKPKPLHVIAESIRRVACQP